VRIEDKAIVRVVSINSRASAARSASMRCATERDSP
jgi:hypothetical protein